MKNQDWKLKYQDLKLKFHDAVDVAFRLGFQAGAQNAQVQQSQQAQAATQQMDQQHNGQEDSPQFGQQEGSELDQHIGQLEGLLGQAKPGSIEEAGLKKSLDYVKSYKQKLDFQKSEQIFKSIGKALNKPFVLNKTASKNMSETGKKALNMQEQIVNDLMKAMAEEEKKAAEAVTKTLGMEQILRG